MNGFSITTIFLLITILLNTSCSKDPVESGDYLRLVASNWGIGINFNMDREQIESVLGEADLVREARNKLSTDLIWLPAETGASGVKDSQLKITVTDSGVFRILNQKRIADEDDKNPKLFDPPIYVSLGKDARVGANKSNFESALGEFSSSRENEETWDFSSLDGQRLRITVRYQYDEDLDSTICHSIVITTGTALPELEGEARKNKGII